MTTSDRLLLILHRTGWSIAGTAFVGKEALAWLVYGTNGSHTIQANRKPQAEPWKRLAARLRRWGWFRKYDTGLKTIAHFRLLPLTAFDGINATDSNGSERDSPSELPAIRHRAEVDPVV
jgi:hypothetical protein